MVPRCSALLFDFFGVFCPDISLVWFNKTPDAPTKLTAFSEICDQSDRGELTRGAFYEKVGALAGMSAEQAKQGIQAELHMNESLIALLPVLKKRFKLAIISNTGDEWVMDIMRQSKLMPFFDEIILSSQVGYVKPQKEIFDLAGERLGVSLLECMFVDDRKANIGPAKTYGMDCILFTDTPAFIAELAKRGVLL